MEIAKYAPENAGTLTENEILAMQSFSDADIDALAKAYPNKATQRPYLILGDSKKKENEQLFPISTWKNLSSIRKTGLKNFYALSFASIFNKKASQKLKVAPVQDLTKKEAKSAPGLKAVVQRPAPKKVTSTPVAAKAQKATPVKDEFPDLTQEAKSKEKMNKGKGKGKTKK